MEPGSEPSKATKPRPHRARKPSYWLKLYKRVRVRPESLVHLGLLQLRFKSRLDYLTTKYQLAIVLMHADIIQSILVRTSPSFLGQGDHDMVQDVNKDIISVGIKTMTKANAATVLSLKELPEEEKRTARGRIN
ncbi:hypothetical protein OROGR_025509 [Orobanche gracilis]